MEIKRSVKFAQDIYLDIHNAKCQLEQAKYILADRKLQALLTKCATLIKYLEGHITEDEQQLADKNCVKQSESQQPF